MNTKKLIASLLEHPKIKENLQYQQIQKLCGNIWIHNVVIEDKTTYLSMQISFLGDIKSFWLYKNELDFWHITLKKFAWRVDPQLIVTWFVRIWKSDCEDILHNRSDKENINVRIPGPLTNDPWWIKIWQLKKLEKY
jgi:hypothetical protein